MSQQPKTLTCPNCGNVNTYTADECIRCGMALGPIREAMENTSALDGKTPKPKEPVPPIPQLPSSTPKNIGYYIQGNRLLVRGMGNQSEIVTGFFVKQLTERKITSVSFAQPEAVLLKQL